MSEQSKIDAERAAFETAYLKVVSAEWDSLKEMVWSVCRELSLPVGVPEGSIYVECRQCDECQHGGINDAAAGLAACHDCDWTGPDPVEDKCPGCQSENSMAAACPKCGSRYVLVASEDIAAPAATTVKAEQVQCETCQDSGIVGHSDVCPECQDTWQPAPSLPAAGSAVEEVEVVGYRWKSSIHTAPDLTPYAPASTFAPGYDYVEPLMTVAQHNRIVAALRVQIAERDAAIEEWSGTAVQNGMEVDRLTAALSAQQSAPERVGVPRDLLADLISSDHDNRIQAERRLYALLASHGLGEANG